MVNTSKDITDGTICHCQECSSLHNIKHLHPIEKDQFESDLEVCLKHCRTVAGLHKMSTIWRCAQNCNLVGSGFQLCPSLKRNEKFEQQSKLNHFIISRLGSQLYLYNYIIRVAKNIQGKKEPRGKEV